MHVEGNNDWGDYAFPGFVSDDDDEDYYDEDSDYDDDDDDDDEHYIPRRRGLPLVEVLSVVINKNKYMEKNPSLYGTILFDDGRDVPEYIYNTKREDSESISLSGGRKTRLSLTGLSRTFAAADTFSIKVNLMDNKGSNLSPDDDDVFCIGRIYWNFHLLLDRKYEEGQVSSEIHGLPYDYIYDKPLATNFVGRSSSVKVNYIMWWEGVSATVEVSLLNRDGAADVYGLIRAGNNRGTSNYWSVLFQKKKKSDDTIDVRPGQLIPLSRSVVAVNRRSSLQVSVELFDRRRNSGISQDDEIAEGTVDFPAQLSGMLEKNISGRNGEIQVQVTWRPC